MGSVGILELRAVIGLTAILASFGALPIDSKSPTETKAIEIRQNEARAAQETALQERKIYEAIAQQCIPGKRLSPKTEQEKRELIEISTRCEQAVREREQKRLSANEQYNRAMALRKQGKVREAVRLLRQASVAGYGPASRELSEIYMGGEGDQQPDVSQAGKYDYLAKAQGYGRGSPPQPVIPR